MINSDQVVDERCELFGGVFLKEVSGVLDDGVWLTFSSRYPFLKYLLASLRDRVAIAKRREEWFVEPASTFQAWRFVAC